MTSTATRPCRAKNPATCRTHGSAVTLPIQQLTISEQIAANFAAREEEKKAVFRQEWKERSSDWKDLGFQHPISARKHDDNMAYWSSGKEAIDSLTEEQRSALRFYSSNNYKWVNAHLFGKQTLESSPEDHRSIHDFKIESLAKQEIAQNPTLEQANEAIVALDSILDSHREEARVLYRGQNFKQVQARTTEELHKYVDTNFKIGETVNMDGYLSTSPSAKVGLSYAIAEDGVGKKEGIFFELKTSKGLNITAASLYTREAETLLPRNTKWKVAAVHKSKVIKSETPSSYGKPITKTGKVTLIQMVEVD